MGLILNTTITHSPHGNQQQDAEGKEIAKEEEHPSRAAVVDESKKNRRRRSRRVQRRSSSSTMAGFSFSSSIPLGVFWWLVFLEVLAATVDNSNFMLPRAEAKPLVAKQPFEEEMCTATLEIETHQLVGKRVGLAEFGKSLNDNDFNEETLSFLTVLPDNYTSLCDDEDGDSAFAFFESVRNGISDIHPKGRPKAKIALLVDLASGDCDLLTRATNALKLQTDFASFKPRLKLKLKYVLFYVNRYSIDGNWGSTIPKLSLDETWPSTVAGPTCFLTHSNDPSSFPTSSPKPSASPSEEPSGSFLPSSAPSVSLEPSLSPSFGPSSTPSASMGPSSAPSVSSEPSLSPSFTPTSAPTVSWLPTSSRAPTLTSLPTTSLSTTLPIPDSNNVFPMGTNNIFDKTIPQKREVNSKNREGGWELQDLKLQRENQKKIIEENNSMVFLSISTSNAEEILHPFCENNLMHMVRCVESSRFVRYFYFLLPYMNISVWRWERRERNRIGLVSFCVY